MNGQAFLGAWKKEWKMMKNSFTFILVISLFLVIGLFGLTTELESGFTYLGVGVFLFPVYVLLSLNTEALQMDAFLHINQSLHNVLLAKFLNGFLLAMSFAGLIGTVVLIMNQIENRIPLGELLVNMILLVVNISLLTIFPTIILLFLWSLYHVFRKFHVVIGIIGIIGFLYILNKLFAILQDTKVYNTLSDWGVVTWETTFPVIDSGGPSSLFMTANGNIQFQIGSLLLYAVFTLLFYLLSIYLLQRKVEV
ncbi:hypothetical protein SAMN05421676_1016 [Salinibacillus kushneri]|uniref:ABC-2 family transporter protein n=1 Tax=Salinibacillus kushneri TaxID=237682 RepID=A0A1H9Y3B0_9BACI|nr:hypothetical protein [Salinibacillus kushneri]SES63328.1 hypothetical protein SAMN05421676_1016 [Salinibacillus kushneri]